MSTNRRNDPDPPERPDGSEVPGAAGTSKPRAFGAPPPQGHPVDRNVLPLRRHLELVDEPPGTRGESDNADQRHKTSVECQHCPVGVASGMALGQFCPFIVRDYPKGADLYHIDQSADHIWFIKTGVVALTDDNGACEFKYPNSFIGAEAVETGRYRANAKALAPTTLCGATREGFKQWMSSHAEILCAAICRAFDDEQ